MKNPYFAILTAIIVCLVLSFVYGKAYAAETPKVNTSLDKIQKQLEINNRLVWLQIKLRLVENCQEKRENSKACKDLAENVVLELKVLLTMEGRE